MRFDNFLLAFTIFTTATSALLGDFRFNVVRIGAEPQPEGRHLFKRKGGGAGGPKGGGGGGGVTSGGSRSGGGSSGSSGSSSPGRAPASPAGSGNRAPSSNAGGVSRGGSGPPPTLGGGNFYPGGARAPYTSGARSPSGILPLALLGGAALVFWPGIWLAGAYLYPYHHPFTFHNDTSNKNETLNVLCGCATNEECSCDDNNSTAYFDSLVGNGSYSALNKSIVNVAMVNGTNTLLINGTLPNGTTANDPNASAGARAVVEMLGFWPVAAAVLATVFIA